MRESIRKFYFATIFFASLSVHLLSCGDNLTEGIEETFGCLPSLPPDTLRFNIVGKGTGEDLFFSETPIYDLDDLKLLVRRPAGDDLIEVDPCLSDDGSHFYTLVSMGAEFNSVFLKIEEQPLDTIVYTAKWIRTVPGNCPYAILDLVTFNQEASARNAHGRVVPFYRKE